MLHLSPISRKHLILRAFAREFFILSVSSRFIAFSAAQLNIWRAPAALRSQFMRANDSGTLAPEALFGKAMEGQKWPPLGTLFVAAPSTSVIEPLASTNARFGRCESGYVARGCRASTSAFLLRRNDDNSRETRQ